MKATLQKASARGDNEEPKIIKVKSLKDIINIMQHNGQDMINPCELILKLNEDTDTLEILIYDDYVE